MPSSSSDILTAEPLISDGGGEFKAQQPANDDEFGQQTQQQQQQAHALFTMLDYALTPAALAVFISLLLVSLTCLALMALAVKRTMWDKNVGANDAHSRRKAHVGGSGGAVIYDISDGNRGARNGTDGEIGISGRSSISEGDRSSSACSSCTSCLAGLAVAAIFVGVAIGMALAIDRTVVALC